MTQSISATLRAAMAAQPSSTVRRNDSPWHPICVCGHPQHKHSENVGGTRSDPRTTERKSVTLTGCVGEPRVRGAASMELVELIEKETAPGGKFGRFIIPPTCPCTEFRPVLEARDLRFRFYQRRPRTQHRGKVRDRDPMRHALMVGIRATATACSKTKEVEDAREAEKSETEIDALIDRLVDERVRWLDGLSCWAKNCSATDVLPYYVNENDLSEMRCLAHRP